MQVNIFLEDLKTKVYGQTLKIFETLESTNKTLIEDINNMSLNEGTVYIALKQTAGKGTHGNTWYSNNDLGLWFSILLYSPYQKEPISFLPAIALAKLLREKYNIYAHVKWPNDVLVKNKKIAGILIQVVPLGDNRYGCIIGIGVNLYHKDFDSAIKNKATSVFLETGKKIKMEEFYKEFMLYFEEIYNNNESLVDLFNQYSLMINKKIKAIISGNELYVTAKGITKEGYLKVEIKGKEETWMSRYDLDIDTNY